MIHSGEKQDGGKHTPVLRRNAAFGTHTQSQTHVTYQYISFFSARILYTLC